MIETFINQDLYREIGAAARDLARKGLSGNIGDPLPNLMSTEACAWINLHVATFKHMVTQARIVARCSRAYSERHGREVTA